MEPNNSIILQPKDLENLITWIMKRYKRDAFPDEFNKRIQKNKLKELLKNATQDIWRLCIQLNTYEEIPNNAVYSARLTMLVEIEDIPPDKYQDLSKILEQIVDVLEKQKKIVVQNYRIKSLSEITLAEFLLLKEIDFDYLSFP
jgi:hypothetical protein